MVNSDDNSSLSRNLQDEKTTLIAELKQLGIKHNSEQILKIVKLPNGKIVFLERGKGGRRGSGLQHILERHQDDFAKRGIVPEKIPDLLINAIIQNKILGYQGTVEPRRTIYEVYFNGKTDYVAITISNNGYIVGANPSYAP